jgi:DNA-binding response OmpR family regulator
MDSEGAIPVLIASGDAGTRAQVVLTLGDERFVAHEADHTDEALRVIATVLPPLVVMDVGLQGAGALAITRSLRQQPETAGLRTLLLTRRDAPVAEGVDGVDATLALPFTAFALLRKVDGLLDPDA